MLKIFCVNFVFTYLWCNLGALQVYLQALEVFGKQSIDLFLKTSARIQQSAQKTPGVPPPPTEMLLSSYSDAISALKKAISLRKTGYTKKNNESSRSHGVFTFILKKKEEGIEKVTKITFYDVAGSEGAEATEGLPGEIAAQSKIISQDIIQVILSY